MSRRTRSLAALALAVSAGACGTPRSVRNLTAVTAPFLVATHGSIPGVERAYAAQVTRTNEELVLYDARRRAAERDGAGIELLWSLRETALDKRSVSLMERIRRDDALLRNPPPATTLTLVRSRTEANVGQITKVTELLKAVGTSKVFDPEAALVFGAATWKQLKAIEADALADAESKGGTEAK